MRPKARPGDDKKMRFQPMNAVDHLLRSRIRGRIKGHGIPITVLSPILPVLYDPIQRNLQRTISLYHIQQFELSFISLAGLKEPIDPEWHQWRLARQFTHTGNYSIATSSKEEIIVRAITDF